MKPSTLIPNRPATSLGPCSTCKQPAGHLIGIGGGDWMGRYCHEHVLTGWDELAQLRASEEPRPHEAAV